MPSSNQPPRCATTAQNQKKVWASTAKSFELLSSTVEKHTISTVLLKAFGESYLMPLKSLRSRRNDYSPTRPESLGCRGSNNNCRFLCFPICIHTRVPVWF